ncbi:FecR domain-containing protein, partial [Chloroflexota bacterium]
MSNIVREQRVREKLMQGKLAKAFEECLDRIKNGEPVKVCLAEYPNLQRQLVPLLSTALAIETAPKAVPSEGFRKQSRAYLMAGLRDWFEAVTEPQQLPSVPSTLGAIWQMLRGAITEPARVVVPIALVLVILIEGLFQLGGLSFSTPNAALVSKCTLSTMIGNVELQSPDSNTWQMAENGMTLDAGSMIKTGPDSDAVLTFFNGTTVKLEPGTVVEVKQLEGNQEDQPTQIVLKQSLGRTWSRVTKLVDPDSHYEIETLSAMAVVRGTQFITDVDETGTTRVQTIEGLVSVIAEGEEVYLPAGKQTMVEPGTPPTEPTSVDPAQTTEKTIAAEPAPDKEPPAGGKPAVEAAVIPASPESIENESDSPQWQAEFELEGQYEGWLVASIVGLAVFSCVLTLII